MAKFKAPVQRTIMNAGIRAEELRVLGANGENYGVMTRQAALMKAQEMGLDIILIAEGATPPVAKIIDYGKHMYFEAKKEKEQKSNNQQSETKVLRVGVSTGDADLSTKAKQGSAWLKENHRVKIDLKLERRENYLDPKFLKERLEKILIYLTEDYRMAEGLKKAPNSMSIIIERQKGKSKIDEN
jgi:translation initiation factor IF-3